MPGERTGGGFGDRLTNLVAARRSQLVLGLDPDPSRLWPRAVELPGGAEKPPAARAALAVAAHCTLAIEAVAEPAWESSCRPRASSAWERPGGRRWARSPSAPATTGY